MRYVIDGLFLTQQLTGIQRYAFEITSELDKLVSKGDIQILVPESAEINVQFENIEIVPFGKFKGIPWQQIDLCRYARKNKCSVICFTNVLPLAYTKGFIVLHDISCKVNPQFFTSKKDRLSALWHRLHYFRAAHSKMKIITVSEFSKSEIIKYYHIDESRITIAYNSWEHIKRIASSDDTFEKYPQLKDKEYYFSMCTLAPNKNLKWVINCAKANSNKVFAIAGGGKMKEQNVPSNVYLLGYVTDEDAKTLMANCKGFIFPTLYEGFGIPPLEAIACGTKNIYVSDTPCMREIYEDKANFIDLSSGDYNVINFEANKNSQELLDKYSWQKSAQIVFNLLGD